MALRLHKHFSSDVCFCVLFALFLLYVFFCLLVACAVNVRASCFTSAVVVAPGPAGVKSMLHTPAALYNGDIVSMPPEILVLNNHWSTSTVLHIIMNAQVHMRRSQLIMRREHCNHPQTFVSGTSCLLDGSVLLRIMFPSE